MILFKQEVPRGLDEPLVIRGFFLNVLTPKPPAKTLMTFTQLYANLLYLFSHSV